MIIFLGGLIGTGKTTLAARLSERLQVPHYDIDGVKKLIYPSDPDFERNMREGIPFSDETRIKVFQYALSELQELAHTHPSVVVDETFHKESLRRPFFDGAKGIYGASLLVHVTIPDMTIKERLARKPREGHILTDPYIMYLGFKKAFEPFQEPHLGFENILPADQSAESLEYMVRERGFH